MLPSPHANGRARRLPPVTTQPDVSRRHRFPHRRPPPCTQPTTRRDNLHSQNNNIITGPTRAKTNTHDITQNINHADRHPTPRQHRANAPIRVGRPTSRSHITPAAPAQNHHHHAHAARHPRTQPHLPAR